MALTPQEKQAILAQINEIALAVDDRVNATTNAARLAARTRFVTGFKNLLLLVHNGVRVGSQNDYDSLDS